MVGGYKNDTQFFDEVLGENARNAYRNVRVAKFASPAEASMGAFRKALAAIDWGRGA